MSDDLPSSGPPGPERPQGASDRGGPDSHGPNQPGSNQVGPGRPGQSPQPGRPHRGDPDEDGPPPLPLGLRLAFYYLLFTLLLQLGGSVLLVLLMGQPLQPGDSIDLGLAVAAQALLAPWVMMMTRIYLERVDGRPVRAIGVAWPGGEPAHSSRWLLVAAVLAAAILAAWAGLTSTLGTLELHGWDPQTETSVVAGEGSSETPAAPAPPVTVGGGSAPSLGDLFRVLAFGLGLLVVSVIHEWGFRGYVYSALRDRLSWIHAAGLSALLYGLYLAPAADLTPAGLTNILLIAFLLAALRELSGSVWVGAVFHGMWNFFLGCLLSLPVSGDFFPRLLAVELGGAEALTGGDYGPEGSWAITALLILVLAVLVARIGDRGPLEPPPEPVED